MNAFTYPALPALLVMGSLGARFDHACVGAFIAGIIGLLVVHCSLNEPGRGPR